MAFIKATSADDLGKRIELLSPSASLLKEDPELGVMLGRISESIYNSGRPFSVQRSMPLLFGVVVAIGITAGAGMMSTAIPPWAPGLIVFVVMFVVVRLALAASRRRHSGRIVESLLRIGRCPCCGYDLRCMVREPSGMCVCPECASGWRFERVGHASVPPSDLPARPDSPGDTPAVSSVWFRMTSRTPTIVDDRDRSLPCVDISLPGIESEIGAERGVALREEIRRATLVERVGCSSLILLFGLFWLANAVLVMSTGRLGGFIAVFLAAGVFMLVTYSMIAYRVWSGRTRSVCKPVVARLKRHRVCPSCGADLVGVAAEGDGCTLCGRCGGAWKLPDTDPTPLVRGS